MTRPAQIRIVNCICFLDLHARAPPGGYFGHPLQVLHVVPRLDGVSLKMVSLIGITCQLKRGGRGGNHVRWGTGPTRQVSLIEKTKLQKFWFCSYQTLSPGAGAPSDIHFNNY